MTDYDRFREETRAWLEANCPQSMRSPAPSSQLVWAGRNKAFPSDDARVWFERMVERGWTVPDWPAAYGGGGLDARQTEILKQEMKRLRCRPPLQDLGIFMLGPALLEHGTEAQKREHLPKIARGEIRWCQGYSEPGAGSDLASLQTRAEDMGDHFVVNGAKIWTTYAHLCDWIFCLVRTDPDAPKHAGISFLLIDMDQPGIRTSPIQLISGASEFCETLFDNARAEKHNVIGPLNGGWTVAKSLLVHERKMMSGSNESERGDQPDMIAVARDRFGVDRYNKLGNQEFRNRIARHKMRSRAVTLTGHRLFEEQLAGTGDGRVALTMKMLGTEEKLRGDELMLALLGTDGLGWEGEIFDPQLLSFTRNWLFGKALTIAGGSSEVQRNVIAKRALELPQ